MKTALIYPPTCDPTAPYIALPVLAGFLRAHGEEVLLIDANVAAYRQLLRSSFLQSCAERVQARLAKLKRKSQLSHVDKLAYQALLEGRSQGHLIPDAIEDAVAIVTDRSGRRFFDPLEYEKAITTITGALRLISAAYTPLTLDFTSYRTPFSLLSLEEIRHDARSWHNPFHDYFSQHLCPMLEQERVNLVGISVAFPGQIQSAYALAMMIRQQLPGIYITVGGPAITQILLRLEGNQLQKALTTFDSAVLFEGEWALLNLIRAVAHGDRPGGIITGTQKINLADLPVPDFDGLPLDQYFAPALVLPYDPSRGCYWGRCAFCHYGLAATGTACYRERPVEHIVEHLRLLTERWGNRIFYFSHDTMAPDLALRLARVFKDNRVSWRWATDMRPERKLTPENCHVLAEGGALATAPGIESAAPRILRLMQKGIKVEDTISAITNLANAGIAVEAMCFTGFPTETFQEALATVRFLETQKAHIALFICGQFDLVNGANVARFPGEYGIEDIWQVQGDEFLKSLFYRERMPAKSEAECEKIDSAIDRLARDWWLHRYPWAGSLSTAHTLLWYDRYGANVFKRFAGIPQKYLKQNVPEICQDNLEPQLIKAQEQDSELWYSMIYEQRTVTRKLYEQLVRLKKF